MHRPLLVALALALTTACAAHEGAQPESDKPPRNEPQVDPRPDPQPEPQPEPEPEPNAKIAISSVTMVQDCADPHTVRSPGASATAPASPKPTSPAAIAADAPMPPAKGASATRARRVGPGGSLRQPCTQSTMQLAITETAGASAKIGIEQVRLVRPDTGAVLATIEAREPTAWNDAGQYTAWDETLEPDAEVKASYEISVPNWSDVDTALGQSSMGHMFALEVDIEVDGVAQTVRSPEFARERPHVVVT